MWGSVQDNRTTPASQRPRGVRLAKAQKIGQEQPRILDNSARRRVHLASRTAHGSHAQFLVAAKRTVMAGVGHDCRNPTTGDRYFVTVPLLLDRAPPDALFRCRSAVLL